MSAARHPTILCYLHCFDSGGVELTALRLCSAWAQSGARVKLLIGREEGPSANQAAGLECICFGAGGFPRRTLESLWMILCLWRQLRRDPPDLIFCAGNTYAIAAVAMKLLLGRSCPPIIAKISNALRRRDMPWPLRVGYALWLRIQGRLLNHIVATTEEVANEVAALMRPARLSIVPNPSTDRARLARLALPLRQPPLQGRHVLAVGRLVAQKRFDLLIRAFFQGSGDADRLFILGDGPERRPLERLIVKLGGIGRVHLLGYLPDTIEWFRRCHLFVLSSDYEGLPSVMIDALAAGIAIVATDCSPAMASLLEDNLGRVVVPGDLNALAAAIRDAGWTSPIPEEAFARARLHCVENAAPRYLELMGELVGAERRGNYSILPPSAESGRPYRL